jgi:transcriptional regulator with XRE-family HTH domain
MKEKKINQGGISMKKDFLKRRRSSIGLSLFQMAEKYTKVSGEKISPQALGQYENWVRYANISQIMYLQKCYNMTDEEVLEYLDLCRIMKYGDYELQEVAIRGSQTDSQRF